MFSKLLFNLVDIHACLTGKAGILKRIIGSIEIVRELNFNHRGQ